jgi:hypothetical protein
MDKTILINKIVKWIVNSDFKNEFIGYLELFSYYNKTPKSLFLQVSSFSFSLLERYYIYY